MSLPLSATVASGQGLVEREENLCKSATPDMKTIALLWKVAAKISDNVPKSLGQGLQAVMKVY